MAVCNANGSRPPGPLTPALSPLGRGEGAGNRLVQPLEVA